MASTAFSAQGATVTVDIATTPTNIANVISFDIPGTPAAEIEVTNLQSVAKEFLSGLQDFGTVTMNVHPDYGDAGQNQMRTLRASGAAAEYVITLPDTGGTTLTFDATVRNAGVSGGVDQAFAGSFELRITGNLVVA
jgi:hypothetical protein